MDNQERPRPLPASAKFILAPIHAASDGGPLRLCIVVRAEAQPDASPFVLLRELPGSRVYLGVVCDAEARVQEWVEIWVQSLDLRDLTFSHYQEQLANDTFDQRWLVEYQMHKNALPEAVLVTGMEVKHPSPVLIKQPTAKSTAALAPVEVTAWQICRDDALLESVGLPPYSTSPYRYLHDPTAKNAKDFLRTADDAPANEHVQSIRQLSAAPDVRAVFNPHAGLVRVNRFHPLQLEDYLQILEGRAWDGIGPDGTRFLPGSVYAELQAWSASPKGIPFLLHGAAHPADKRNEIFFLKLALWRDMFQAVRSYVKAQQLPLLNLTPASFHVGLARTGDQFPALWSAKCHIVKPGQAHPLQFKTTAQRYFIRLGRIEPSPFLPEGLGAHSFGIGSVRLRNVLTEADGLVLEGTLVAEDYLALDAHDLLWFKLPLAEDRIEFYAHVHTAEAVGPREARFRTVPAKLPEPLTASLQRAAGSVFQKSPYEIWPLLSSPCDLYSLGILGIRLLLANSTSNLPVIVDEVLSLARHLGKEPTEDNNLPAKLSALVEQEQKLLDLVSPHSLIERAGSPAEARAQMAMGLWFETISVLLRLFPGAGAHSYCQSFGDVSPVALETVFDAPLQELETLLLRLRSVVAPSLAANEEIAAVILQQLAKS